MGMTQVDRCPVVRGLDVSMSHNAEGTVVTLSGEADVFTREVLVDALVAAVAELDGAVIVDLSSTEFIDAGSMRVLARASQELQDHGRAFVLRSPSRIATRVIDFFGLNSLCEGYPATA